MRSTNGLNGTRTSEGHGEGKRATRAEKEQRIVLAMTMIIQGFAKSEIKSTFRTKWGVGGYQTERYLRLARERLAADTGLSDDFTLNDMKVQHYAVAMSIVRNSEEDKDRLAALKHAGSIYGVQAPMKIAPTTPDGKLPYSATKEALRELSVPELEILQKVRERVNTITAARGSSAKAPKSNH